MRGQLPVVISLISQCLLSGARWLYWASNTSLPNKRASIPLKREHLTDGSSHDIVNAQAGGRGRIRTKDWFVSSALTLAYRLGPPPRPGLPRSLSLEGGQHLYTSPSWSCAVGNRSVSPGLGDSYKCSGVRQGRPPRFQMRGCRNRGGAPGMPNRAQARRGYPGGLPGDSNHTEACSQAAMRGRDLLNAVPQASA